MSKTEFQTDPKEVQLKIGILEPVSLELQEKSSLLNEKLEMLITLILNQETPSSEESLNPEPSGSTT